MDKRSRNYILNENEELNNGAAHAGKPSAEPGRNPAAHTGKPAAEPGRNPAAHAGKPSAEPGRNPAAHAGKPAAEPGRNPGTKPDGRYSPEPGRNPAAKSDGIHDPELGDIREDRGPNRRGSRFAAVIALFLLIYIPFSFNWFSASSITTDIIRDGSLYEALHTEAIVIRNEELIYSPAGGFTIPAANEGERVPGNSLIATIYSSFTYDLMNEFEMLNQNLLKEQYETLGKGAVFSQEVESIDNDVKGAIKKMIPELNRNSLTAAATRAKLVNGLLVKRAEAYGALETDDPYINSLKAEKAEIEKTVAEGSSGIYSDKPGHLSFILDGYECELNPEAIQTLDGDRFTDIIVSSGGGGTILPSGSYSGFEVKEGEAFAKVVKDNIFYLAIKAPAAYLSGFSIGGRVRLRTENPYLEIENAEVMAINYGSTLTAGAVGEADYTEAGGGEADYTEAGSGEADYAGGEDGGTVYAGGEDGETVYAGGEDGIMVLRVNKYLFDFLSARTVSVALVDKYIEGLKVPIKCLRDIDADESAADIVLLKGTHASVRRVRILASNDIYAIIESYDPSAPEGRVNRYDTYIRDAANIEDGMQLTK